MALIFNKNFMKACGCGWLLRTAHRVQVIWPAEELGDIEKMPEGNTLSARCAIPRPSFLHIDLPQDVLGACSDA